MNDGNDIIMKTYAMVQVIQTDVQNMKEQIKKDNLAMHDEIEKINVRLDLFEKRMDKLEQRPGLRAQAVIDTAVKFAGLGVLGYIGTLIAQSLKG